MKQIFKSFAFAAIIIAAASCTKAPSGNPVPAGMKQISFSTDVEETADETKTVLDGKTINWEAGDAICVWDGTNQNKFNYDTKEKTFSGTIAETPSTLCAYYPEIEVNTDINAVLKNTDDPVSFYTFLPSMQKLRPNSISQGSLITACRPTFDGEKLTGTMQIMCGFIRFTIGDADNSKVAKVRFTSKSKYYSGRCELVFGTTKHTAQDSTYINTAGVYENKYVECTPASGEYFQNGSYYVAVLPYNTQGTTITVTTTDGKVYEYDNGQGWVKTGRNQTVYVGQIDSKIASGTGLTSKYSILVDFINNTSISGVPSTSGKTQDITVPVNGTSYTMAVQNLYGTVENPLTFNGTSTKSAYLKTPAISGKTLKEAIVTWVGKKGGNGNAVWIKNTSTTDAYTGKYFTNKAIDGTTKKTYAIPVIGGNNSYPYRVSHVFVLGSVSKGENSQTVYTPSENTSYYIFQGDNINSLVEQIQLIYE